MKKTYKVFDLKNYEGVKGYFYDDLEMTYRIVSDDDSPALYIIVMPFCDNFERKEYYLFKGTAPQCVDYINRLYAISAEKRYNNDFGDCTCKTCIVCNPTAYGLIDMRSN